MNKFVIILIALCVAILTGCTSDRVKSVELDGLFIQGDTGTMAIGSVDVMASPKGEESAVIKYDQDTPWINPTGKSMNHIKIMLTGTNATDKADVIVEKICNAFVPAASIINGTCTNHTTCTVPAAN